MIRLAYLAPGITQSILHGTAPGDAAARRDYVVHGVIWEVHDIALTCLNLQLGVPSVYDRFGAFARDLAGQLIISEFFATQNRHLGSAHPSYLSVIVEAARKWELPESYIEEIQHWDIDRQAA